MREMGETKIITILTICIMLVSVGLSGCVEEEKIENIEALDNLTGLEVDFKLKIITNPILLNSEEIIIKVSIKNQEEMGIRIYKYANYGIYIINPDNISYSIKRGNISLDHTKMILKPNNIHSFEMNLKDEIYENQTDGKLSWEKVGKYEIKAMAYYIESNWVEFEIKNS
jgi:hypothetical protein